jgi:excinuclease UvrABC nuclease subunit
MADVEVIITSTEYEALILENNLIKQRKPRYNINLKDGKAYPVIRKGHQKAVGAVARHVAKATFWILKKGEGYREPRKETVSSTKG